MPAAPTPQNEHDRLFNLRSLHILDTPPENRFDRITRLATALTGCAVSTITLVDESRQWFKSVFGQSTRETPREMSFCAYAILSDEPLVVQDAAEDVRFSDNPLVTGNPGIRAYAGVPLISEEGYRIGTLCVIHFEPRTFSDSEIEVLHILAAMAIDEVCKIEWNRAVKELQAARAEADRASRTKSDFLAMMSHEIRTPLNGVIGFSELMVASELSPDNKEYAAGIRASAETLRTLLNDLLDFSKIEAGRLDLEMRPTSVAGETELVRKMFEALALEKGIELKVEVDASVPERISTDPTRLRQILCNLVSNAIKFTGQGSIRIKANYDVATSCLQVSVCDTGLGIDEAHAEKLFEPYTQASASTSRKFGGTGLGLAICRRLCEMLGGYIRFESVPGQGTTFFFTLKAPVVTDSFAHTGKVPVSGQPMPSFRILAAEDNVVNQRVLELTLKKLGCSSLIVSNGKELMRQLEKDRDFDVVLLDVHMPEMNGLDAVREIRRLEARDQSPRLPVIAFTADVLASERAACLEAGMDAVLNKPLKAEELLRELRTVGRTR
ncbi:MAG: ATP-binding protein [Candidatus Methylacidiphilales bacterium]|nr:ATP-binding protein [Candidatus Methylacidiphilales bacterium]